MGAERLARGYTEEAAQSDHRQWRLEQRFLKLLDRFDETEISFIREAMERGAWPDVDFAAALEECRVAIMAHRAARAA